MSARFLEVCECASCGCRFEFLGNVRPDLCSSCTYEQEIKQLRPVSAAIARIRFCGQCKGPLAYDESDFCRFCEDKRDGYAADGYGEDGLR